MNLECSGPCLLHHPAQQGSDILAASSLWAMAQRTASFLITGISHWCHSGCSGLRALALHCVVQGMLAARGNWSPSHPISPSSCLLLVCICPAPRHLFLMLVLSSCSLLLILLTEPDWLHGLPSPEHSRPNLELPHSGYLCFSLRHLFLV